MAFCPNCGGSVDGRFCPKCGTAMGGTAPAPTGPVVSAGGMTDNVAAALCYVLGLITGILFLVIAPYNQNKAIRFHAFQSIFFHVAVIACYMVLGVMSAMMHFMGLLFPLIGLGVFVLWLYLLISAYQGKQVVLPVIGPLAQQQA